MMTAMLTLSLALNIIILVIGSVRECSLPESISALVYTFKHKWLWTLWLWLTTLLTLIPAIDHLSRVGMEFLGFGTFSCIMFCGAMPLFDKDNIKWHWITGIAGCILSQLCVWFIFPDWLSLWGLWVFLMGSTYVQPQGWLGKTFLGKGVLLAECICDLALKGSMLTIRLIAPEAC